MSEQAAPVAAAFGSPARRKAPRRRNALARHEPLVYGTFAVVSLLVVWEVCWQLGLISPLFFSGPTDIAAKFVDLAINGSLAKDAIYTGKNFFIGFFLAFFAAVPLGVALGWYRRLNLFFDPIINALYAMPRIALYPSSSSGSELAAGRRSSSSSCRQCCQFWSTRLPAYATSTRTC
jgi:NitT/TauT family transport system permease protein